MSFWPVVPPSLPRGNYWIKKHDIILRCEVRNVYPLVVYEESSIQLTLRMGRKGVSRVWRMHDSLHVRSNLQLLLVSICLFGVVVKDPLSGKFC